MSHSFAQEVQPFSVFNQLEFTSLFWIDTYFNSTHHMAHCNGSHNGYIELAGSLEVIVTQHPWVGSSISREVLMHPEVQNSFFIYKTFYFGVGNQSPMMRVDAVTIGSSAPLTNTQKSKTNILIAIRFRQQECPAQRTAIRIPRRPTTWTRRNTNFQNDWLLQLLP